jgi:hypothetical protein
MAIITVIKPVPKPQPIQFPALRQWIGRDVEPGRGVVVLFTDSTHGVCLANPLEGVNTVGKWGEFVSITTSKVWGPCEITLASED